MIYSFAPRSTRSKNRSGWEVASGVLFHFRIYIFNPNNRSRYFDWPCWFRSSTYRRYPSCLRLNPTPWVAFDHGYRKEDSRRSWETDRSRSGARAGPDVSRQLGEQGPAPVGDDVDNGRERVKVVAGPSSKKA